ncbi:MAG: sulfur carrier protein ThiS adenylyltransferase ThiF [Chloroflexota bacterium]
MTQVTVNERVVELLEGESLFSLAQRIKPDADLIVWNGFPVELDRELAEGDTITLIRRGEQPSIEELEALMAARHTPGVHQVLKKSCVAIAGCGGLGSNVALSLARVGVGHLILADHDVVVPSNLNRQQFFADQIGEYKVDALRDIVQRANPFVQITTHRVKLDRENIPQLLNAAQIVVEAFDSADEKVMIIETVLTQMKGIPLVVGSGMAGYGNSNAIQTQCEGNLYICGDQVSEAKPGHGLMAPRVAIAANHQANLVVELLMEQGG